MLESQSCLISRALPSSCEQESKWVYMTYHLIEVSNGKRRLEEEGEEELLAERKSMKREDAHAHEKEEITQITSNNLSLSLATGSDQQANGHLDKKERNYGFPLEDEGKEVLLGKRKSGHGIDLNQSVEMTDIILNAEQKEMICKCQLEEDGEQELLGMINSAKQVEMNEEEEMTNTPKFQFPSQGNQSDEQWHNENPPEMNCKLPLEDKKKKLLLWDGESSKAMDTNQREEMTHTLNDLTLSLANQSNQVQHDADPMHMNEELFLVSAYQDYQQGQDGDQGHMNSLIQPLGRDISINCLLHCSRSEYNSLSKLNRSFRNLIRNGELYKLRRKLGVIEHWVYFSCQALQWEAFDPISRRWMRLPPMPPTGCFMYSDKESLAVGTELLVFGKEITSHVIWRYTILTNSWSSGMEMNAPRCLFGSASLGDIAILAGGCDSRGRVFSSAELYNSETGTWEILPSMNQPRKMCSGVFMDGKFYVIGGKNTDLLTCGEEYNLETRTWREIPNMSPRQNGPAEAPPLVAVVNNELYAADYTENELMKFDKERISWVTVGRLPERVVSVNGWGLAFRACGEHLIVISGPRSGGGIIELNSWVPNDGPPQWNLLANRHSGSFVYNCAVMGC